MKLFNYILVFGLLILASVGNAYAQGNLREPTTIDLEQDLKAAYLYHFTKYIEWPEQAERDTFYIGILNNEYIFTELSKVVKSRNIKNKPIQVYHYTRLEDFIYPDIAIPQIEKCNILFISGTATKITKKVLEEIAEKRITIIGESDTFIANSGMINFFIERNKLRFELNYHLMMRYGFRVSPKLLSLAKLVDETGRETKVNEER